MIVWVSSNVLICSLFFVFFVCVLGIAAAFKACDDPRKVNVCVGAYRDENGKPWVLPSVHQAERILWENAQEVKEYLPIEGDADFVKLAMEFAYGPEMPMDHLAAVQTVRRSQCIDRCVYGGGCVPFIKIMTAKKKINEIGTTHDKDDRMSLVLYFDVVAAHTKFILCPFQ